MTHPANLLSLMDLLARMTRADGNTPVVTDRDEALMDPTSGVGGDGVAEVVIASVPKDPSDVQTVLSMADMLTGFATTPATTMRAGLDSPVVIAPYGGPARWVTDISHENGRITLHTTDM